MVQIELNASQSGSSVQDLATSADKVTNLLTDIHDRMDTIYNQAESDRIKESAKLVRDYIGNNQDAIVGNIKTEEARIARVTEELINEDTRAVAMQ